MCPCCLTAALGDSAGRFGSDGLIPVVADLRSVLALFPPPPLAAEDMKDF